jgi:hypothetical protein
MASMNENNENNDGSENRTTYSYEFTVHPITINQDLLDIFNIFDNRITNVVNTYESNNIISDVQSYVNSTEIPRNVAQSPMLTIPAFNPNLTLPLPSISEELISPVEDTDSNTNQSVHVEDEELTSHVENADQSAHVENADQSAHVENADQSVHVEDEELTSHVENADQSAHVENSNQTSVLVNNTGGISWDIPNSPIRYRIPQRRVNDRLQNLFNLIYQQNLENQILNQVLQESFEEEQERQLIDMARELDIKKIKLSDCDAGKYVECRICLCDYNPDDKLGILPCGHDFHFSCIQEWGKRKPNCPYCDIEIPVIKPDDGRSAKKQKTN